MATHDSRTTPARRPFDSTGTISLLSALALLAVEILDQLPRSRVGGGVHKETTVSVATASAKAGGTLTAEE